MSEYLQVKLINLVEGKHPKALKPEHGLMAQNPAVRGDFLEKVRTGAIRAHRTTVERFTPTGLRLSDGAELDVDVAPVRGEDGERAAGDLADAEAVTVDDLEVELHAHEPDGHHAADAAREAVAEVVPVLDERVGTIGVIGHQPQGGRIVRTTIAK